MRSRWLFVLVVLAVVSLIPVFVSAQTTGKIRGRVIDAQTKEPLPGANIIIKGTSMGASTDRNGNYVILDVPVGKYTLVCNFIGYKTVELKNIYVTQSLTTEANFALQSTVIKGASVVIVAKRPLVNKNRTNEVHVVRGEDIQNLPVRGVANIVALQAGVVNRNGLHVRGGRSNETARYVNGVLVTLPLGGGNGLSVINESVEEVAYQAGGFTAEYGFANSGVVSTVTKTGGNHYNLMGEVITDDIFGIKSQNYQWLGLNNTYSYGYNRYISSFSGPVPFMKSLKFYVAGERAYDADNATFFKGFHQDSLEHVETYYTLKPDTLIDTTNLYMDIPPGRRPGGGAAANLFNGNIVWDHKPIRVKIGGSYAYNRSQDHTADPRNFYSVPLRGRLHKSWNGSSYMQITHLINPKTYYTLNLNYFFNKQENGDPVFWEDLKKYGDPTLNPALVDTSKTRLIHLYGLSIGWPNTPQGNYNKQEQDYMGVKLDLTHQWGNHELKTGGEMNYYTVRRYSVDARRLLKALSNQKATKGTPKEMTDYDVYYSLFLRNFGYDIYGNEINSSKTYTRNVGGQKVSFNGEDAPKHPIMAAYYIQDKIELKDLVLNAGVRMDYFDTGTKSLKDLSAIKQGKSGTIDESNFGPDRTYTIFSPRLGFSFPVTDQTVFHAQYGKFVQMPDFTALFGRGYAETSNFLYGGGYAVLLDNPNLKPERTTAYEFGFQQQFGLNAALDLTAFYKDTRDLATLRVILPTIPDYRAPYFTMNQDFGTIKGLSATFNLRRTARVQVLANYTLSFAKGTGSNFTSHFDIAWQEATPVFPTVIAPLDFDQRHKGTVNVDVRTRPDDGPVFMGHHILGRVGLNLLFTYHSGNPFTRVAQDGKSEVFGYNAPYPIEAYNSSHMPWFYNLDMKLDKTFDLGPVSVNAYLWALNVLNTRNVLNVFRPSGDPQNDAYLQTPQGRKWAEAQTDPANAIHWYNAVQSLCGTRNVSSPRQVRVGLRFEFK